MSKQELKKPTVKRPESGTTRKMTREEMAKYLRRMRDRDAELVSGIFKNLENPATGGSRGALTFTYKAYPDDEYVTYHLEDGERYQIPRGVARHLNTNCYYKEYQHLDGERGTQGIRGATHDGRLASYDGRLIKGDMQLSRKVHRTAFHSLEYMDDDPEMIQTDIVEVSIAP